MLESARKEQGGSEYPEMENMTWSKICLVSNDVECDVISFNSFYETT